MPDLSAVLAGLGDSGARIFQATVDAVGTGVVTIRTNGGTFTDVPYMQAGFYPAAGPAIGDPCYVIAQENWGLLCLGKPAPGPVRTPGGGAERFWAPRTIGISQASGGWTTPGTDEMPIVSGVSTAVYFHNRLDLVWSGISVATASFYLEAGPSDTDGMGVDWNYLTLGLHSTAAPGGTFTPMANLDASYRISTGGSAQYVSIPLDWANRLISGEAKGIYVRSEFYPVTVSGPGTVRLTEL